MRKSLLHARAENGHKKNYLQIIPIIVRKMLLLEMKMPCLRQHKNGLITGHQRGPGSCLTDDLGKEGRISSEPRRYGSSGKWPSYGF